VRVGIDERPQDGGEARLRGTLLAHKREHRIWPAVAHGGEQPCKRKLEIVVGLDVQKQSEDVDRTTCPRLWQWEHAGRAAEAHRHCLLSSSYTKPNELHGQH